MTRLHSVCQGSRSRWLSHAWSSSIFLKNNLGNSFLNQCAVKTLFSICIWKCITTFKFAICRCYFPQWFVTYYRACVCCSMKSGPSSFIHKYYQYTVTHTRPISIVQWSTVRVSWGTHARCELKVQHCSLVSLFPSFSNISCILAWNSSRNRTIRAKRWVNFSELPISNGWKLHELFKFFEEIAE